MQPTGTKPADTTHATDETATKTVVSSALRVPALDGVRGIAILTVMVYHATMNLGHTFGPIRTVLSVTQGGWLGVDIFFALSGFLITGILYDARDKPLAGYLGNFYWRRTVRIFPLYYGVLLLMLLLPLLLGTTGDSGYQLFLKRQPWLWPYGANMAREYYGVHTGCLEFGWFEMTHFWSLAVEEHFYLGWPLAVYLLRPRALWALSIVLILTSLALQAELIPVHDRVVLAALATPKFIGSLLIGGLGALIIRTPWSRAQIAKWSLRVMVVGVLIAVLGWWRGDFAQAAETHFQRLAVIPAIALTTTATILWVIENPTARLTRWLESKTLVWFGTLSYGLYVYHCLWGPVARAVPIASFPGGYTVGMVFYVVGFLAAPIAVSMVSYRYFELPLLRLKDWRRMGKAHSEAPAEPELRAESTT